jgi:energy-coupling factor transporter ATP-binding protein EcfA2
MNRVTSDPHTGAHAAATRGLSKRYGRETALNSIELRVPDGAVYVLVGASDAGKSTTFKVLMNLERPDAGSAQVFGAGHGRTGRGCGRRWLRAGTSREPVGGGAAKEFRAPVPSYGARALADHTVRHRVHAATAGW